MTLAISGASGQLGRIAAESVLRQVDPSQVVLLTRSPERLADLAARGADVRQADFDDPAGLTRALDGVERLLMISTDAVGTRIAQQQAAIDAAKEAGVAHILYTSIPGTDVPGNPALVVPEHKATEDHLKASGLAWTFLRNNLYPELALGGWAHAIATGQLVTNAGEGGLAYVTREDCGLAAAAALVAGAASERRAYDITGPEAITPAHLARLLTAVSGRPVAVVAVDDASFTAGLEAAGLPADFAALLASFGTAVREGLLDGVSGDVAALTGREPTALATVLESAKAQLLPEGAAV